MWNMVTRKSTPLPAKFPPTSRILASFVLAAVFAAVANADHRITLRVQPHPQNNCAWGFGLTLSNFPHNGVDYTDCAIFMLGQAPQFRISRRIRATISLFLPGCQNDCFGGIAFGEAPCSMTEWNFDAPDIGGATDYDISNIQGYSVPQQIIPDSGTVLTCTSATCPCNEAYRPGDTSGTCGGTGPKDQATHRRVLPVIEGVTF
ncbi:hypothetical protein DFH08DRAFT_810302 [Mycena albidolilacea]|uniref:Uncharacterized protein n=1 Tax=Mycena albidolilacea TaxID=1033008 RepID=A0AAD7EQH9_9AGAR|nr:hypothetical protein DFH08DRAFT_810302 [Mycena albidolilacea]